MTCRRTAAGLAGQIARARIRRVAVHRATAAGPLLAMDLATLLLVDVDIAIAVVMYRVAMGPMVMDAMLALVLDLVLVTVVVMATMPVMGATTFCERYGTAGGATSARHPIGPMHRHLTFGVTAMLALGLAAVLEIFLFVFGLANFRRASCIIDIHLFGLATTRMAAAAVMRHPASFLGLGTGLFHFLHRRTIPFRG